MRCVIALISIAFLVSCSSTTIVGCPPVINLSPEVQGQMAADLELLPADSPLGPAFLDYLRMRDDARACQSSD